MGLAELERLLVHPVTGLVNDLIELHVDPGDPSLFFYAAQLPDLVQWTGFSFIERSSAAGETRQAAIAATLGEAVERYAAAVAMQEVDRLLLAPWTRLGNDAVDPRRFALYAPEQYTAGWPFSPPAPDLAMRWVPGWSLTQRREVLVPAQFVYLPYHPAPNEPVLLLHTSTGTACGEGLAQATLSALCEVIERDAFMIHWLCRLPAPRLGLAGDPELAAAISACYQRQGIAYHSFDFTTDIGVPCCFAAVVEEGSEHTALAVGAAARPAAAAAARKAILESVQTRVWLRQMARAEGLRRYRTFDEVQSFEDHVQIWGYREMLPHAAFLLEDRPAVLLANPCPATAPWEQVGWVVERLAARGLEAIVVDITPHDIRSLGLAVVRAIVPGAIPLSSDHRFEPLGGERLYQVPRLLGYGGPRAVADFNPVPHPFP